MRGFFDDAALVAKGSDRLGGCLGFGAHAAGIYPDGTLGCVQLLYVLAGVDCEVEVAHVYWFCGVLKMVTSVFAVCTIRIVDPWVA